MAVSITDITTIKRLVAAGNDELWYEDIAVPGTMTELAAANGDIDTSDQLIMFEAYQKVFVINGANLKVADFVNTKITISALTTAPAKGDILTQSQGGSDYAYMVVDFVNTAKTLIYGYAYYGGSASAFNTTAEISSSGSVMDPDPIPGANISAITVGPHWYDYTVYPGGSSGTMPNKAYLGCTWRGAIWLAGNSEKPNQWYKSRNGNPWDLAYVANDTQSPVAGGENPAVPGEAGDIVRALIPLDKNYMMAGCATSMYLFSGDPADGGSLHEIDKNIGIFGATSWCIDGEGNVIFWGTGGINKITKGVWVTQNISAISLPDLIKDEAADPSTHRITMAYDVKRFGIVICITLLADGSNSNYFYSLNETTKGFYPESYPDECGPYSLFYYAANDNDYRDLLVGCKDGYIRKFDPAVTDDDVGGAISSHVTLGPLKLASEGKEGLIHSLSGFTTGGGSGGTESDSNDITYKIFTGQNAGDVAEKMIANTSPRVSGTLQATGRPRGRTKKRKIRGVFAGIRVENTTAGETMSFDRLVVNAKEKGRIK